MRYRDHHADRPAAGLDWERLLRSGEVVLAAVIAAAVIAAFATLGGCSATTPPEVRESIAALAEDVPALLDESQPGPGRDPALWASAAGATKAHLRNLKALVEK